MKHWTRTYYVYETFLLIIGTTFLLLAQSLEYLLFNYAGIGLLLFAMVLSYMEKRKND